MYQQLSLAMCGNVTVGWNLSILTPQILHYAVEILTNHCAKLHANELWAWWIDFLPARSHNDIGNLYRGVPSWSYFVVFFCNQGFIHKMLYFKLNLSLFSHIWDTCLWPGRSPPPPPQRPSHPSLIELPLLPSALFRNPFVLHLSRSCLPPSRTTDVSKKIKVRLRELAPGVQRPSGDVFTQPIIHLFAKYTAEKTPFPSFLSIGDIFTRIPEMTLQP